MAGAGSTHVSCTLGGFVGSEPSEILGQLTDRLLAAGFDSIVGLQHESWKSLIPDLQSGIGRLLSEQPHLDQDTILIEYTVPVIRRRIDAVILHQDKIVVIEYKQGSSTTAPAALRQAQDYALDLADFHELSHSAQIFPIALGQYEAFDDTPTCIRGKAISSKRLAAVLGEIFSMPVVGPIINQRDWATSRYFPVPPVVEAAVSAFNNHSVEEIAIARADPDSLARSEAALLCAVSEAKSKDGKVLCVLTGVPGAGKTLAGLNAVARIQSQLNLSQEQASYLSGNTHDGEAGLEEWGRAVLARPHWSVWTSEAALTGGPSVAGSRLFAEGSAPVSITVRSDLHLDVSIRSIDAENNAAWVNAVLACDKVRASDIAKGGLPVFLTRDLGTLRRWLLAHQVGSRRVGMVASSGAERLRALGIETPTFTFMRGIDYVRWFLEPGGDVRSSNQLEVALSEFEVQGLELDYVGMIWGGDLVACGEELAVRKFVGTQWSSRVSGRATREGLNRYRVLMTRYRKAMAILVPEGSVSDSTRKSEEFDSIYGYLVSCGARSLEKQATGMDD